MMSVKITSFLDVAQCTSSVIDGYERFKGTCYLHLQGKRYISASVFNVRRSDVKMKAAGSSKSLVPIYQGIRCHIQVDRNLDLYHWLILSATCLKAPCSAKFLPMIFSVNTGLKQML